MSEADRMALSGDEPRPARTWPRRLRGFFSSARRPGAPRRRSRRPDAVRRSWLAAAWQARGSVRAGVPLDDYLRARLGRYLAGLAVPRATLPVAVEVVDGAVSVRPAAAPPPSPPPSGEEAWLAPLVEAEGPAARQDVWDAEARIARAEQALERARARAEEIAHRLAADVSAGLVPAPEAVDATPEQLGRPPVRSGAPAAAAAGFALAALVAETWQVAVPLLAATGLSTADLRLEAARRPVDVAFSAVFALGVATALFVLAHVALQRGIELFRGEAAGPRARWIGATTAAAAAGAAALAATLAALHPGTQTGPSRVAFGLLLVAVPFAAAFLLRAGRAEAERRAQEEAAALAWDRSRAQALSERARRLEELRWAEAEVRALSAERDEARSRLRVLDARAVEVARAAADAARIDGEALERVARSLVGALELDRWEFVREATARGAPELLGPRRVRAEPRPGSAEPPPDGVAPVAAVH